MSSKVKNIIALLLILCCVVISYRMNLHTIISSLGENQEESSPILDSTSGFMSRVVVSLNTIGSTIPNDIVADMDAAKEINEDVAGWIRCEGLNIDYPVLFSTDNKKYLRTAIDGSYDVAGAIYLDANYGSVYSPMKLIHGHNMKDGSMFSALPKMLWWESLDDAPPIIYCDSLGMKTFKIFSVFSVDSTKESVIISEYTSLEELKTLKETYLNRSWVRCSGCTDSTELLMLNTCWYGTTGTEHNLHCIVVCERIA